MQSTLGLTGSDAMDFGNKGSEIRGMESSHPVITHLPHNLALLVKKN
jgi:hypothetical protein